MATSILKIQGMTCQGCARKVREALQRVQGVRSAEVDLGNGRVLVRAAGDLPIDVSALIQAVRAVGFGASAADPAARAGKVGVGAGWRFNVVMGLAVTVPLMVVEWTLQPDPHGWFAWVSFAMVLPVQVLCGWRFYRGAWQQLKVGQSNMDTLVSLGSTAAFTFSVYGLFAPEHVHHLYFIEAAAIITLISVGHYMEAFASDRAAGAVRELLNLAPQTARRLGGNGREELVPVAELQHDDLLVISPGDQIPTDGIVAEGESAVDESMLTGESLPVEKSEAMELYGGTVNQSGRLVMRVTALGEETALARIIEVVKRAQHSRADIQRIGDRVSSVFVPVVVLVAVATAVAYGLFSASGWEHGIINAAAVLIVACPCAMGLATPAAIMAGTNAAARRGILIRDGEALEKSGKVTAVLFDKTGTLTEGRHRVESWVTFDFPDSEFQALALALAHSSQHPLSRAISRRLDSVSPAAVSEWREHQGAGVSSTYKGLTARLGSLNWLRENGMDISSVPSETDSTVIALALGSRLIGALLLVDSPKPHAKNVVSELIRRGLAVYLISGDSKRAVETVGRSAGISTPNIYSEIRPEEKAGIVERLQHEGQRIAFVGDGINDAPALAQADLGIAVTRASDVAREAADIILLKSDIEAIPEALGLAQATLRTIKQNLFWAFFYNAIAIPLAATGQMSPILCATAMAFSDLFVIGNALRLFRWKAPGKG
ncbi:MAG: cation-translocating P-type ATPase [Verrucomicrobiota bacterium]